MIGIIFEFAGDFIEIRVRGNDVLFRTDPRGGFATIDNLKLRKEGVVREFPDLKDVEDWRHEAIQRFKNKIRSYKTEEEKINYIKEDLKDYGYKPIAIQREGFRSIKLK